MPIDPRALAAVMQRMQPAQGPQPPVINAPPGPGMPPPGGQVGAQPQGVPVQMQGSMMMKPAVPGPGGPAGPQGSPQLAAPGNTGVPMAPPPRRF